MWIGGGARAEALGVFGLHRLVLLLLLLLVLLLRIILVVAVLLLRLFLLLLLPLFLLRLFLLPFLLLSFFSSSFLSSGGGGTAGGLAGAPRARVAGAPRVWSCASVAAAAGGGRKSDRPRPTTSDERDDGGDDASRGEEAPSLAPEARGGVAAELMTARKANPRRGKSTVRTWDKKSASQEVTHGSF